MRKRALVGVGLLVLSLVSLVAASAVLDMGVGWTMVLGIFIVSILAGYTVALLVRRVGARQAKVRWFPSMLAILAVIAAMTIGVESPDSALALGPIVAVLTPSWLGLLAGYVLGMLPTLET